MAGLLKGGGDIPATIPNRTRPPDRKWDDWANPFGIALDLISTPGDIVKAGVQKIVDPATDFTDSYMEGIGAGDIVDSVWHTPDNKMRWHDPQRWARTALGFAGEIALDPLSYIGAPGAAVLNRGGAKRLAASMSEPGHYMAKAISLAEREGADVTDIAARFRAVQTRADDAWRAFHADRTNTALAQAAHTARRARDIELRRLTDELPADIRDRLDTSISQLARSGGGAAAVTDEAVAELFGISTGLRLRPAFLPTERGVVGGPQIMSQPAWARITGPVRQARGAVARSAGWQKIADQFGRASNNGLRDLILKAESASPEYMRALLAARSGEAAVQDAVGRFSQTYAATATGLLADLPDTPQAMNAMWEASQTPRHLWADEGIPQQLQAAGVPSGKVEQLAGWYAAIDNELRAVGAEHGNLGDVYLPWRIATATKQATASGKAAAKMPLEMLRRVRLTYAGEEVPTVAKAISGDDPIGRLDADGYLVLNRPGEFHQAQYLRDIDEIGRRNFGPDFKPVDLITDQRDLTSLYVWEAARLMGGQMRENLLGETGLGSTAAAVEAVATLKQAFAQIEQLRGSRAAKLDEIAALGDALAETAAEADSLRLAGLPADEAAVRVEQARSHVTAEIKALLDTKRLPAEHRQPLVTALRAIRADQKRRRPIDLTEMADRRSEQFADLAGDYMTGYRAAVAAAREAGDTDKARALAAEAARTDFVLANEAVASLVARTGDAMTDSIDITDAQALFRAAQAHIDDTAQRASRWLDAAQNFKAADPEGYAAIRAAAAAFERRLLALTDSLRARYAAVSTEIANEAAGSAVASREAAAASARVLSKYRGDIAAAFDEYHQAGLLRDSIRNEMLSAAEHAANDQSNAMFETLGTIFGRVHRGRQMIDPDDLIVDAARWQLKTAIDTEGVVAGSVGDPSREITSWNPFGSSAVVWRRLNGDIIVIDGHQRTALARRLIAEGRTAEGGAPIRLPAYVLEESDGWSRSDALLAGSMKNVIEGSVTPFDYAQFLRRISASDGLKARADSVIASASAAIGAGSELLQNAARLNRLSDDAFHFARDLATNPRSFTGRAPAKELLSGISYGTDTRQAGGAEWWIGHVGDHIDDAARHSDTARALWAALNENPEMRTLPAVSEWLRARNQLTNDTVKNLRDAGIEPAGAMSMLDLLDDGARNDFAFAEDVIEVTQIVETHVRESLRQQGRNERMAAAVQDFVIANTDATAEGYEAVRAAAQRLKEMELPELMQAMYRLDRRDIPQVQQIHDTAADIANRPALADSRGTPREARSADFREARKAARAAAPKIAAAFRADMDALFAAGDAADVRRMLLAYADHVAETDAARLAAAKADAERLAQADQNPVQSTALDDLLDGTDDTQALDAARQADEEADAAPQPEPEPQPELETGTGTPAAPPPEPRRLTDEEAARLNAADTDRPVIRPSGEQPLLSPPPPPGVGQGRLETLLDDLPPTGKAHQMISGLEGQPPSEAYRTVQDAARLLDDSAQRRVEAGVKTRRRTTGDEPDNPADIREVWDWAYNELGREVARIDTALDEVGERYGSVHLATEVDRLWKQSALAHDAYFDTRTALLDRLETEGLGLRLTATEREEAAAAWAETDEAVALQNAMHDAHNEWVELKAQLRRAQDRGPTGADFVAAEVLMDRRVGLLEWRDKMARNAELLGKHFDRPLTATDEAEATFQAGRALGALERARQRDASELAQVRDRKAVLDARQLPSEPLPARPAGAVGPDDDTDAEAILDTLTDRAVAARLDDTDPVTANEVRLRRVPVDAAARLARLVEYETQTARIAAAAKAYEAAYEALEPAVRADWPRHVAGDVIRTTQRTRNGKLVFEKETVPVRRVVHIVQRRDPATGKSYRVPRMDTRGMLRDPARVIAQFPETLRRPLEDLVDASVKADALWRETHAAAQFVRDPQPVGPKLQTETTDLGRLVAVEANLPAAVARAAASETSYGAEALTGAALGPDTLTMFTGGRQLSPGVAERAARIRYADQQQTLAGVPRNGSDTPLFNTPPPTDRDPDLTALQTQLDEAEAAELAAKARVDDLIREGPTAADTAAEQPHKITSPEMRADRIREAIAIDSKERKAFEDALADFAPAAARYATLPAATAATMDLARSRLAELELALPGLTGRTAKRARTEIRLMRSAENQAEAIMRHAAGMADLTPEMEQRFAEAALIAYQSEIARAHAVRYSAQRAELEELEDGVETLTAAIDTLTDEAAELSRLAADDTRVRSAIMHQTVHGAAQWRDSMTSADIAAVFETADRAANLRGWERHIKQGMKWFRGLALMSPGFHVRNSMSGMWSNWTAGVTGDDYRHILPEYAHMIRNPDAAPRNPAARRFIEDAINSGIAGRGVYGTDIEAGQLSSVNPFAGLRDRDRQFAGVTLSRTVGNHVESGLRLTLAWRAAREIPAEAGIGARMAAAKAAVDNWHFDYSNLSHVEQRIRDYVVPFWTWQSRNIPLMMAVFAHRPQAVLAVERLFESIGFGQPTNPFTPEWYDRQRYRQVTDNWFLNIDLPHVSAIAETSKLGESLSSPGAGAATLAVSFNPWLRSAVELSTGRDASRGYELDGSERWRRALIGAIPPLGQAARLMPGVVPGATEGMKHRYLSSRLAYLGVPLRKLTDYDEQIAYLQLQAAR